MSPTRRRALSLHEIALENLVLDELPAIDAVVLTEATNSRVVGDPEVIVQSDLRELLPSRPSYHTASIEA